MRGGEPVPLTPKAFEILLVLIQNRDRVMEKDEMMRLVWPGTVVEENNLTRNISNLRKALGEGPNDHRFIVTVPGRGYQFAGEASEAASHTEVVLERRARVLIEEQSETETDTAPRTVPMGIAEPKFQRRTGLRLVVAAATCLLLAASGWLYVSERRQATLPTQRVVPVTALPDSVWCSSISPDGNYVAFARHSDSPELSGVWVKQVGSENYTQLTRNAGDICPAW